MRTGGNEDGGLGRNGKGLFFWILHIIGFIVFFVHTGMMLSWNGKGIINARSILFFTLEMEYCAHVRVIVCAHIFVYCGSQGISYKSFLYCFMSQQLLQIS